MTERLKRIFNEIPKCKSFADVGCDHGFIAEEMIKSGKCDSVIISDISAPSLKKAEKLLKKYIDCGLVTAVCTDGLNGIDPLTEVVLIAGMGGEEIIKIIKSSSFLPPVLVLQPMKNIDKVRINIQALGYGIVKDYLFYDKKYYNLLVCRLNEKVLPYSQKEILFGRDNLSAKSPDFLFWLKKEIALMEKCLSLAKADNERAEIKEKFDLYNEILNGN